LAPIARLNRLVGQSPRALRHRQSHHRLFRHRNKPPDKASSDATRVLLAATDLCGEADTASSWFRNEPVFPISFKSAEQLLREGLTEDVLAYLQSLQAGAVG
jgi:uncharacterized protein (DUF2384 family)